MSPDTPDPERAADRTGGPGAADGAAAPDAADPAAADVAAAPDAADRTDAEAGGPGSAAPDLPGWPAGLPVTAGTPVTAPGADPLAGHPGVAGLVPGAAPAARRTGRLRAVATTVVTALLVSVLGVPLGLLWAAVAPDTPVRKTAEGAVYATTQPEQPIAADGWFSLLGLGFGVLVAIALWIVLRRRRGPAGLLAGVLGGLGAAVLAWQVGRRIGLGTYQRLVAGAPDGTDFTKPADLRAGGVDWYLGLLPVPHGNLLLAAFGAAVTYTLLAGWSRWPSLRPEPVVAWPLAGPDPATGWPPPGPDPATGRPGAGPGPDAGWPGISSGPEDRPAR